MAKEFDPGAPAAPGSGIFGQWTGPDEASVHLLGVPFDATTSYRPGAAEGPAAILAASHQVDLFDPATGRPYEAGIWMAPLDVRVGEWNRAARAAAERVLAAGGLEHAPELAPAAEEVDALQTRLNQWVEERARAALDGGKLFGVVGGDHSVALGSIRAHAEHCGELGLLHIDAHADLRVAYEGFRHSHASILDNVLQEARGVVAVLQVGLRDLSEAEFTRIRADPRLSAVFDTDWAAARLAGRALEPFARQALAPLPHDVYVTLDVDGLDPSLCPSTGTPVPGGLTWHEAMLWLEALRATGRRIVGFDLTEVAPTHPDAPGTGWDEIVGARLLYRLIGHALASRTP